jgi:diadenosine tetraphosphatase ApaH/serine/threonine PP2A family protein phosphatase
LLPVVWLARAGPGGEYLVLEDKGLPPFLPNPTHFSRRVLWAAGSMGPPRALLLTSDTARFLLSLSLFFFFFKKYRP